MESEKILDLYEEYRPFYNFFDFKSYLIMAIMMGGGIWLRSSGLAPDYFIAFFYTGLGLALFLAGGLFIRNYFFYKDWIKTNNIVN